jgi:single-strand DNA-binding protein
MIDLAKALIIGRLTQDPEIRYTPKGMAVVTLRIAVNRRARERPEETSFFDVVAFGKLAETCGEYLSKGRTVLVDGRLRERQWEGKEGRRSKIEVIASSVEFLDPPPDHEAAEPTPEGPAKAPGPRKGRGLKVVPPEETPSGDGDDDEEPPF